MKAVRFHETGGPEKLRYEEIPRPSVAENEVLVRVRACALNRLDIYARSGSRKLDLPMPHISGSDTAGEVSEVGKLVEGHAPGEKIIVAPGLSCRVCEYCTNGWDSLCASYKIIGYQTQGGYAEYVAVPKENVLPIPDGLGFEEASSVPLVFLTAWHMLVTRAHLQPGETVLVWAAGSGVGSAAVQVAKILSARVVTTVGKDEKIQRAKEIGADYVINHHTQNVPEEVKKATKGAKVNVVFDHIGAATWEKSMRSMAPGGRLVNCGVTSGGKTEVDIRYIFTRQFSLLGSYMGSRGELINVLKFFEDGRLKPVVDSVFPLEEAGKAQARMEQSSHFGKIVLKI